MSRYQLTKKAEADLDRIVTFSQEKFGAENTSQLLARIEHRLGALAAHEYEGPELFIASRGRSVRRWPVPPYWIYYDRAKNGDLRVLRIYHGARAPL